MRTALYVGACLLVTGCGYLTPSKLLIRNGGTVAAENVVVSTSHGDRTALGDLPPGETVRFSGHLQGEGSADISYTVKGKRVNHKGCYYTGGMPVEGAVTINGEAIEYRC